jgi:inner membrane transporter RhtA
LTAGSKNRRVTGSIAVSIAALAAAMVCFQLGAVLAKGLFPVVGAVGAAAMRLAIASVILFAAWRPWRLRVNLREARTIIVYGVAMGWMNLFFYLSLRSIPLGIAMALEFTGPLGVALAASRRPRDFLWVLMAILGVLVLLPLGFGSQRLPPVRGVLGSVHRFRAQGGCRARRSNHGMGYPDRRCIHRAHRPGA